MKLSKRDAKDLLNKLWLPGNVLISKFWVCGFLVVLIM